MAFAPLWIDPEMLEPHPVQIESAYRLARERYAALGIDTEAALGTLEWVSISVHCWQGDDVRGFEPGGHVLGGGLAVTGSYPGRARNVDELREDLDLALALMPGSHRLNLHAIYGEFGSGGVERDAIGPEHFAGWIGWARDRGIGLDFNPTFFAHPLAADGLTLSHPDPATRAFWIRHGQACRRIGQAMGRAQGSACVTNVWIPDGSKDTPADRKGPRERLAASLDEVFAEPMDEAENLDAVEGKLFGLGAESYTVGSHEFYLGYAITRRKLLCLDMGHYHPTECVADKLSAVLAYLDRVLLHVSRGVRWDSDHVVTEEDEVRRLCVELVRGGYLGRVHLGLEYFDASINRVAAWIIGGRALRRALLHALLEPSALLCQREAVGDLTARLALQEEFRALPVGAVWDYFCLRSDVPVGTAWLDRVRRHEAEVLAARG